MTEHNHLLQLAASHGLTCEAQDPVHGDCSATATWIDRNGYVLCEACADDSIVEVAALTAGAIRALGDGLPFDVQGYFRRVEGEGSTTGPRRRARVKVGDHVRSLRSGHVYIVVDKFQDPTGFRRVLLDVENVVTGLPNVFGTDEVERVKKEGRP